MDKYLAGLSALARRPNNSFKPTPCRGVGHVLCATLARVRRPATGRLNSGVRAHFTNGYCQTFHNFSYSAVVRMYERTKLLGAAYGHT